MVNKSDGYARTSIFILFSTCRPFGGPEGFEFGNHTVDYRQIVIFLVFGGKNTEINVVAPHGAVEAVVFKHPAHLIDIVLVLLQELKSVDDAIPGIIQRGLGKIGGALIEGGLIRITDAAGQNALAFGVAGQPAIGDFFDVSHAKN